MRAAFALLLVVLPGCASVPQERPGDQVAIVWHRVDNPHAVCESLSGRKAFFNIHGCSRWSDARGVRTCEIYVSQPQNERDLQRFATLGHELMHCFDGNWHDRWGRMDDARVAANAAAAGSSGE